MPIINVGEGIGQGQTGYGLVQHSLIGYANPYKKDGDSVLSYPISFLSTELTCNAYQTQCYSTAIYPEAAKVIYPILGLLGEVGEVAEKMRDYLFPCKLKDWDDTSNFLKEIYHTLDDLARLGISAGKTSKKVRDKNKELPIEYIQALKERVDQLTVDQKFNLGKETGDIVWFISTFLGDMNLTLGDIAQQNLDKLQKRKEEGKLSGDGDNR